MPHQEVESPQELRTAIAGFWYTSQDFSQLPASFEVAPDGYAEIIFNFGSGCSLVTPAGLQPLPTLFLVGLLNQPVVFHVANRLEIIGIRCFPWTVFELLGRPAAKGSVQPLEHPLTQLHATLAGWLRAGQVAEALAEVARYAVQTWLPGANDRLLGRAGQAMQAANGTLPVSQVAAAAHATVRTLERKFKQASGYTVKDVSSLMRFERARHLLWQQPAASLAGLAHELGYTDQTHLGREFKRYSGTTPAAFARKARKWQQTVSADFVAFILA